LIVILVWLGGKFLFLEKIERRGVLYILLEGEEERMARIFKGSKW